MTQHARRQIELGGFAVSGWRMLLQTPAPSGGCDFLISRPYRLSP